MVFVLLSYLFFTLFIIINTWFCLFIDIGICRRFVVVSTVVFTHTHTHTHAHELPFLIFSLSLSLSLSHARSLSFLSLPLASFSALSVSLTPSRTK